jgi:osmotically inducible protein OsmC
MNKIFTAEAHATSGRSGKVISDDGALDLQLSLPKELGGPGGSGTNPEQLFAGGYSACFGGALGLVAGQQKIKTGPFTVTAHVTLGKKGEAFGIAVELKGTFPELAKEQAEALMKAAHEVCPYSNATRGNVDVTLSVG